MGAAEVIAFEESVQENSGTPCAGSSIPALTSGLMGWKPSSKSQHRPWRRSPRPCGTCVRSLPAA